MKRVLSNAEGFLIAMLILFSLFGAVSYCAYQAMAQEGIFSFPTTWRGFINTITSRHDLDPVDLDIDELLADLQKSQGTRKAQIMRDLGLGVSNNWAQSAIPVLLNEVENLQNTVEVRLEAAKSLVSLAGHARQRSLIPMIRLLGDQDGMIRQQAIEFLVRIGRDARQPLLKQLYSQDDKRFAAAAMALSFYPDVSLDSIVTRLENLIWHPDITVRTHVARALGRVASNKKLQKLGELLKDQEPQVRSEAILALGQGSTGPEPQMVQLLHSAMLDQDERVRQSVVHVLSQFGGIEMEKVVEAMIDREHNESVREAMARALERMVQQRRYTTY